jgi:hypothetical protein
MTEGFKIDGNRELRAKMRRAEEDVTQLKDLHQEIADDIAAVSKQKVPVRSGRLKNSIKPKAYASLARVEAGNRSKARRTGVPYAGPIHFGWASRGIRPQPFMYEALDLRREAVIDRYEAEIKALVNRIF